MCLSVVSDVESIIHISQFQTKSFKNITGDNSKAHEQQTLKLASAITKKCIENLEKLYGDNDEWKVQHA